MTSLATASEAGTSASRRTRFPVLVPILVVLILLGVVWYIAAAQLDSVTARMLEPSNVLRRAGEHAWIVFASTVLGVLFALPMGILLSRRWAKHLRTPLLAIGSAAQALPSIGIIVLLALLAGTGTNTAIVAILLFSLLPLLRNTLVAIVSCPPSVTKAAAGMGMSGMQILMRVELPLGVPVILAGWRTMLVLNVGTAALATLIGAGGLGSLIDSGMQLGRMDVVIIGSLLTASFALLIDWGASLLQRALTPRT